MGSGLRIWVVGLVVVTGFDPTDYYSDTPELRLVPILVTRYLAR